MSYQFTNNASATLAAGIASGDTTITVTAGQGAQFPVPSGSAVFMGTLVDASNNIEIVKVTARAGDSFTVVRAQEGTGALAFAAGDIFELRPTAAALGNFIQKDGDQTLTGRLTVTGGIAGASDTADKLTTSRSISLAGAVVGSASFDGSANITISVALGAGSIGSASLANKAVTNAKMDDMPSQTLKGRGTAGTGTPEDLNVSDLNKLLGLTGSVFYYTGNVVPAGSLEAEGQLISRTTYANLWAYAQASGNITVSDAAWAASKGSYSPGDGATTFRLPDLRGMFVRAYDDGAGVDPTRVFGSYQADDNKSHFHTMPAVPKSGTGFGYSGTAGVNGTVTQTNASGTEARPKNFAYLACIRY